MKLICLNIWGGRVGPEKLLNFFHSYGDVDIFCLQEVYAAPQQDYLNHAENPDEVIWDARQQIDRSLPRHQSYFHSQYLNDYGLQLLINRCHHVKNAGDVFVHKDRQFIPENEIGRRARNLQYATIATEKSPVTVVNFHGLWNGQGKSDSPERTKQSERVADFIATQTTPVVLAGDFNLLPDTESMAIIEQAGLRNLIKEYGITSTRTSLYSKPIRFADYVLVSPQLTVDDFRILEDEVSDHSALFLEFSL